MLGILIPTLISAVAASLPWLSKSFRKQATGSGLTDAQKEQNAFNASQAENANDFTAEQAELSRNFNSEEAAKQRAWETEMQNTQYQRQVQDMRAAGLNPGMMYGSAAGPSSVGGAAATSGESSGVAASGSSPQAQLGAISGLLDVIQKASMMPLEQNLIKSQIKENESNAGRADSESEYTKELLRLYPELTESQIQVNYQTALNLLSSSRRNEAEIEDIGSSIGRRQLMNTLDTAMTLSNIGINNSREDLMLSQVLVNESSVLTQEQQRRLLAAQVSNVDADTELKRVEMMLKRVEGRYADEFAALRNYSLQQQGIEIAASADLKVAQAAVERYELEYYNEFGFVPGVSGITSLLNYLGVKARGTGHEGLSPGQAKLINNAITSQTSR